jgi:nucleotide-binding universal stress UspA family protein
MSRETEEEDMTQDKFKPTRILVPTDFSSSATMCVDAATSLAREFGASIFLLNIIPMLPIVPAVGDTVAVFPEQEYLADARRFADNSLNASVKRLQDEGVTALSGVEIGNDVVGNIMMVLSREQSDLIVISTHGVSGWRPFVFGSIAEKVIKLAECPLLLLRTPKASIKA